MLYIPGYVEEKLRKAPIINLEAQIIALLGGDIQNMGEKRVFMHNYTERIQSTGGYKDSCSRRNNEIEYGHKKLINLIGGP